jgi:Kef-type K+ transport system membrane component KefB
MLHLPTLIAQIGVILLMARIVGWLFRRIGQPQVVGEMVAGLLLGPSILGWLLPGLSSVLFPPASLGFLHSVSQIGLLLFMFVIGLELNLPALLERKQAAVLTSHVSITLPFFLGTLLALYLYPRLSDDGVPFAHFALFLGTAMSITAFPVLARMLADRNMHRTSLGTLAIACAAVDDVTAWCILAGVILLVRSSDAASLWPMLLGAAAYITAMLAVARPALRKLESRYRETGGVTKGLLALILLFLLASSFSAVQLGIHAVFGAFLAGAIMPKNQPLVRSITDKLEDVSVVLLLPLFFAYTGLRTSINLLSGPEMWFFCGLIIAVAVAGKLGGSFVAARVTGMNPRDAVSIGLLMNSRGLMELVVVNIGLDIGVISPAVFAMMVLMALFTTFMTTPLLDLVQPLKLRTVEQPTSPAELAA